MTVSARNPRGRELDTHARLGKVRAVGIHVARAIEHDYRLVAPLGKGGNVRDERGARSVVDIARIGIVRAIEDKALVARVGVDDVVAVDHEEFPWPRALVPRAGSATSPNACREGVATPKVLRRDNGLCRALAKALCLGLRTVLFGHGLLPRPCRSNLAAPGRRLRRQRHRARRCSRGAIRRRSAVVACATFRLSVTPRCGKRVRSSQVSSTKREMPSPSDPITSAMRQ